MNQMWEEHKKTKGKRDKAEAAQGWGRTPAAVMSKLQDAKGNKWN